MVLILLTVPVSTFSKLLDTLTDLTFNWTRALEENYSIQSGGLQEVIANKLILHPRFTEDSLVPENLLKYEISVVAVNGVMQVKDAVVLKCRDLCTK